MLTVTQDLSSGHSARFTISDGTNQDTFEIPDELIFDTKLGRKDLVVATVDYFRIALSRMLSNVTVSAVPVANPSPGDIQTQLTADDPSAQI